PAPLSVFPLASARESVEAALLCVSPSAWNHASRSYSSSSPFWEDRPWEGLQWGEVGLSACGVELVAAHHGTLPEIAVGAPRRLVPGCTRGATPPGGGPEGGSGSRHSRPE